MTGDGGHRISGDEPSRPGAHLRTHEMERFKLEILRGKPKPPKTASRAAKRLWTSLQAEYGIDDPAGLDLLADLVMFFDRREQAREIIRAEGITVIDRFRQKQIHPAVKIERDSSAAMTRILRQLNLDIEPTRPTPGRPPGR